LEDDRLIVSCSGYIYCLNPLTGQIYWNNDMPGYGLGVASLASVRGGHSQAAVSVAAKNMTDNES
jgi:outer membrane protein assembly factor BamB